MYDIKTIMSKSTSMKLTDVLSRQNIVADEVRDKHANQILDRFLGGDSISQITITTGWSTVAVEDAVRHAINKKGAI